LICIDNTRVFWVAESNERMLSNRLWKTWWNQDGYWNRK